MSEEWREDAELLTRSMNKLLEGQDTTDARDGQWDRLMEHGLCHPFQHGAEDWRVGAAVIRNAGRLATGIHVAENVLGSWIIAQAGLECDARRVTLVEPAHTKLQLREGRVSGELAQVPHASVSSHLIAEAEAIIELLLNPPDGC